MKKRKQEKPLAAYDPETKTIYISEELLKDEEPKATHKPRQKSDDDEVEGK